MINSKLGNNIFLLFAASSFFSVAVFLHQKNPMPKIDLEMQDKAININQDALRILSLGNKRLISSLMWVQTLMQSDEVQYKANDRKNWMYLRFKTIASLDPLFYHNYLWGGMYLSIIKDDMMAAADIFDLGLQHYPDDYELNYRQGFNYYFELGEFEKGLSYLSKIENNPKMPLSIRLIVNKLRFETTLNFDLALNYLYFNIQKEKDPTLQNKLISDFYALKAERDLDCLNNKKENCDYRDAEGINYIQTNEGWIAPKKFQPYRIHLPENKKGEP